MIIDASIFYNEIEILDLRILELSPYVDQFIVLDANESYSSNEKRKSLLKSYPKTLTFTLETLYPRFVEQPDAWKREHYQRESLMEHIKQIASSDDILMLSDVDEIPRMSAVLGISDHSILHVLEQDLFYYNTSTYIGPWHGTVVGHVAAFDSVGGLQKARDQKFLPPVVLDGGWHFSYFGGVQRIREKVAGFSHSDSFVSCMQRSDNAILEDIIAGRDLIGRPEISSSYRSPTDYRLPQSFREQL